MRDEGMGKDWCFHERRKKLEFSVETALFCCTLTVNKSCVHKHQIILMVHGPEHERFTSHRKTEDRFFIANSIWINRNLVRRKVNKMNANEWLQPTRSTMDYGRRHYFVNYMILVIIFVPADFVSHFSSAGRGHISMTNDVVTRLFAANGNLRWTRVLESFRWKLCTVLFDFVLNICCLQLICVLWFTLKWKSNASMYSTSYTSRAS